MGWDEIIHMGEQGMKHGGMLTSYKHRTECDWVFLHERLIHRETEVDGK